MIKVKKFHKFSSFAPTQWVGITDNNQGVYIRYRHSNLEVVVGDPPFKNHSNADVIVDKEVEGKNHNGRMKSRRMVNVLEDTEVSVNHKSEISQKDEDLTEVLDNMHEYIRNIDIDD